MNILAGFYGLISEIWHTFDEAALYILFGVAIAGLIQICVGKDLCLNR
jgi:uncharacterized membrane protein YraQ (UPF0718 family)